MLYYIISFALTFSLIYIIQKFAIKFNIVDKPNERKVHEKPKALLGGLALYIGIVLTYLMYMNFIVTKQNISIILLSFFLVIVGVIDDVFDLRAIVKLMFQVIVAFLTAYTMGGIEGIEVYGISIHFNIYFAILIEALWIVALVNAFNLIDGLDGLCSGIGLLSFLSLLLLSVMNSDITSVSIILIIIGAMLAFLYYNFYPSTIFLGDAGSMFIGYLIAIISMESYKTVTLTSMMLLLLISFMPFLDVFLAILRRKRNKQKAFQADALHFHHRLMLKGYSHMNAVLIMYLIMFVYILFALLLEITANVEVKITLTIGLCIITIFIFEKLYLLSDKYAYLTKTLKKIGVKMPRKR